MIEVRIRATDEAEAVHLCTWPADGLDDLIPTLKAWGVLLSDSGFAESGDSLQLTGQVVVNEHQAHFEVVVHGDGEDDV